MPNGAEAGERALARLGRAAGPAWRISASISCASATRMIASPSPVQEIAAVASSAHVPARDQRRVADAAGVLAAACRRSRSRRRRRRARRGRRRRRSRRGCVAANARRRSSVRNQASGAVSSPASRANGAGRLADEHHVPALVEHRAGGQHRVADAARCAATAPAARSAPRMIEASSADAPVLVQRRAAARR